MSRDRHDWAGKAILHPDHGQELEARAADLEFKDRLSRENAETQAYREYRQKHHTASAAHHLRGMKSANGSGDTEEAAKHGAMYELHMKKLGHEPWKEPPPELKAAMSADDRQAVHKFKAHAGDQFVVDEHDARREATSLGKSLNELYVKVKVLDLLAKVDAALVTDLTKNYQVLPWKKIQPGTQAPAGTTSQAVTPHGVYHMNSAQRQVHYTPNNGGPTQDLGRHSDIGLATGAAQHHDTGIKHGRPALPPNPWATKPPPAPPKQAVPKPVAKPADIAVDTGKSELGKAFPSDPSKPVGSHLTPPERQGYQQAATGARADPFSTLFERESAQIRRQGGEFRPGKSPTKGTVSDLKTMSPDQAVLSDQLQEQGFQPERPPAFEPQFQHGRPVAPGGDGLVRGKGPVMSIPSGFVDPRAHQRDPDFARTDPHALAPAQPARFTTTPWSDAQRASSLKLDDNFWSSIGRAAGIQKSDDGFDKARHMARQMDAADKLHAGKPKFQPGQSVAPHVEAIRSATNADYSGHTGRVVSLSRPNGAGHRYVVDFHGPQGTTRSEFNESHLLPSESNVVSIGKSELTKAVPPPGMVAPPKPALHSTVEGFMGGLKTLPKAGPERGKFLTAHINHPPFLAALQAHPQGKAVHGMIMNHLNSTANAGPRAPMQVTAKKELLEVVETLRKGWPRDDAENQANMGAHHVVTDMAEDRGAKVLTGKDLPDQIPYKNPVKTSGRGGPATRDRINAAIMTSGVFPKQPAVTFAAGLAPWATAGKPPQNFGEGPNDFQKYPGPAAQSDRQFWGDVDTESIPEFEPKMVGQDESGKNIYDYTHLLSPELQQQGFKANVHHNPGQFDNYLHAQLIDPQGQVTHHGWGYPSTTPVQTEPPRSADAGPHPLAAPLQHHQSWIRRQGQSGVTVTQKSEGQLGAPLHRPGGLVHDGERNLVVVKVHPAQGPQDQHLYTLRDPVDNTLSHAFEAKLGPTKEQK